MGCWQLQPERKSPSKSSVRFSKESSGTTTQSGNCVLQCSRSGQKPDHEGVCVSDKEFTVQSY